MKLEIYPSATVPKYSLADCVQSVISVLTFNQTEAMAFPFWFIGSLFAVAVVFSIICKVTSLLGRFGNLAQCLVVMGIVIFGFIMVYHGEKFQNTLTTSMVCILFFYLGNLYQPRKADVPMHAGIAFIGCCILGLASTHRVDVSTDVYGNPFYFVIDAVIGIYVIFYFSSKISVFRSRALAHIGVSTIPIMAFQYLGFFVGQRVAEQYSVTHNRWILLLVVGVIVPLGIAALLSIIGIDAQTLSRRKAPVSRAVDSAA